jgi:hypothetical protein
MSKSGVENPLAVQGQVKEGYVLTIIGWESVDNHAEHLVLKGYDLYGFKIRANEPGADEIARAKRLFANSTFCQLPGAFKVGRGNLDEKDSLRFVQDGLVHGCSDITTGIEFGRDHNVNGDGKWFFRAEVGAFVCAWSYADALYSISFRVCSSNTTMPSMPRVCSSNASGVSQK